MTMWSGIGRPGDPGPIHFTGIGGIGMSGIAEILQALGYRPRGTDLSETASVQRLRRAGIAVTIGHAAAHVTGAGVVVVSAAVPADNPEILAARAAGIPVVRRADMLAELMRPKATVAVAGSHGKTTTTALTAAMLEAAGLDPTVINGGVINALGSNARPGQGDWMVVEADESDGSFTRLPATVAIVTGIDPEHLDHYGDVTALHDAFHAFVAGIPFYGVAVVCCDSPAVQTLMARLTDRRVVSYGFSARADYRAVEVAAGPAGSSFRIEKGSGLTGGAPETLARVGLPLFGRHNIANALAAAAAAVEIGVDPAAIDRALRGFRGVSRRFAEVGRPGGRLVVDDYAHHPAEIAATLAAARERLDTGARPGDTAPGRIVAVHQPHRYSRLSRLFADFCTCFDAADIVVIADVHAAGESPVAGADRDALVAGLRAHGHRQVHALPAADALPGLIRDLARPGDLVLCMGAGSIGAWAQALPAALGALPADDRPAAGPKPCRRQP